MIRRYLNAAGVLLSCGYVREEITKMESRSSSLQLSRLVTTVLLLALQYCGGLADRSGSTEAAKLYVAYMGEKQHEDPDLVTALHHGVLSSALGSEEAARRSIVHSYRHGFSGFAAMLTDAQAKRVAGLPGVLGVRLSSTLQLQTTRSWDFLGLTHHLQPSPPSNSELLRRANGGDGIIIGVIDTGIWPEAEAFNDQGYGPVPSRWKGTCQTGEQFNSSSCNRKIIGARWYAAGVAEEDVRADYLSARDQVGHGTHVASIAAGSYVGNASYEGLARGWARGGAPRARLAVYKVLWGAAFGRSNVTGTEAGLLKALDHAAHDGVDVVCLSLVLRESSWGSLDAVLRGITVVYAAGNGGPLPQTVVNAAPWVITVAASTIDRAFPTVITLADNRTFVGQALYHTTTGMDDGFKELAVVVQCEDEEQLRASNVTGKVVLCYQTNVLARLTQTVVAVGNVRRSGAVGLILAQHTTDLLPVFQLLGTSFPYILVDFETQQDLAEYVGASSPLLKYGRLNSPPVKLSPTRTEVGNQVLAPRVVAFSSRGPSPVFSQVLKPDVAAPGVNILAAVRDSYYFLSGTSMAAPHVVAVVALLKRLHPGWSPAALKSAIVTTASVKDEYGVAMVAEGVPRKPADPFDYGGGHINPSRAADPGLVYDIQPREYDRFNCSWDIVVLCSDRTPPAPVYHLNLPSVAIPTLTKGRNVTVSRTVTNVGPANSTYGAVVEAPPGVGMEVRPSMLVFDAATKQRSFTVTFSARRSVQGIYAFGSLTWEDGGGHSVRIPIAVRTVVRESYADVV